MQNSYAKQASDAIYRVDNVSDLYALNKLIVQQLRALGKRATRKFVRGNRVQFRSTKYGRVVQGTVIKVGYKNLQVLESTTNMTWRVSAAVCEAV